MMERQAGDLITTNQIRTYFLQVELCEYVLREKFSNPFQLYMVLKSICSGQIRLTPAHFVAIKKALKYKHVKSVRSNLQMLMDENWVGYNKASGYYFIRGFQYLSKKLGFKSQQVAEFSIRDISSIQPFCVAVVVCYVVKQQKRKRRASEQFKTRSNQDVRLPSDSPEIGVSNTLLAKKLSISQSTAFVWKRKAQSAGYIKITNNLKPLYLPVSKRSAYLTAHPEDKVKLRVRWGKLCLQESDIIEPLIRFKRRRKKIDKEGKHTNTTLYGFKYIKLLKKQKGR